MARRFVYWFLVTGVVGCASQPASNPELASAVEVLKTGLEAWKNQGTPASLAAGNPPVQFTDRDWQTGAKLLEYKILKAGAEDEGETVCAVLLTLEVRGKAVEKSLSYRVTLTPARTISRYPKS